MEAGTMMMENSMRCCEAVEKKDELVVCQRCLAQFHRSCILLLFCRFRVDRRRRTNNVSVALLCRMSKVDSRLKERIGKQEIGVHKETDLSSMLQLLLMKMDQGNKEIKEKVQGVRKEIEEVRNETLSQVKQLNLAQGAYIYIHLEDYKLFCSVDNRWVIRNFV